MFDTYFSYLCCLTHMMNQHSATARACDKLFTSFISLIFAVLKPPFNNQPNRCVTLDDKPYFIARDCAVVAEVCLYWAKDQQWYVLLGKRGSAMPNYQGYWGLPCGYLDWNETLYEAVLRELWEETGLILADIAESPDLTHAHNLPDTTTTQAHTSVVPWRISDTPRGEKQNLSHHFAFVMHWQGERLPALTIDNAEPNESDAVDWVLIDKAVEMDLAFHHADCIRTLQAQQADLFKSVT